MTEVQHGVERRAEDFQAPPQIDRLQRNAGLVGVVGVVLLLVGVFVDPAQFYKSYLVAFVYWLMFPLGALGLLMIHHLSGGGWGMPIRRILEASSRTLPYMAVLFLPVIFGMHYIFEWTHEDVVAADPILQQKVPYLNTPFFIIRYVFYFAVWSFLAYTLSRWSRQQDLEYTPGSERKFRLLSGPGLLVHAILSTFASVDWIMSLDPHWFSTIFGLLFLIEQALAAMSFVILMLTVLIRTQPMGEVIKASHVHDCGKFLLAFTMIWAYFSFSQFLIIWSANLPEEIPWYIARTSHGWQWVGLALIVGQFFLPFFLLLSRDLKRNAHKVARVAAFVLLMRFVDFIWTMTPAMHRETPYVHWLDLAALVGLGGVWLCMFTWQYRARPLLPVRDPYLKEALAGHGAH